MDQNLLSYWGAAKERVLAGIASLQRGNGILVVDDANRENEGDLIFAAEHITQRQMALLIRECSGIVCLCLPPEKAQSLDLPPMVTHNTSAYGTAFTVTIEAAEGVTTGVSASDRVTTIKAAVGHNAKPTDLRRPGHVFPLIAKPQGVLERPGHTEATVDMMRLAGLAPYGVLCEVTNEDGTMARLPQLAEFARLHSIPLLSVEDIIAFRQQHAKQINAKQKHAGHEHAWQQDERQEYPEQEHFGPELTKQEHTRQEHAWQELIGQKYAH